MVGRYTARTAWWALVALVVASLVQLAGTAPARADGTASIEINGMTSRFFLYQESRDADQPPAPAHPAVTVTGTVTGCPAGIYTRSMTLAQGGHTFSWAGEGLGIVDHYCVDGPHPIEMSFYNEDLAPVPGPATATIEIRGDNGELIASATRTVTIPDAWDRPGTPTRITAQPTSASTVKLSWAPSAAPGGGTVTGYLVQRDGGRWGRPWSTTLPASATSFTFKRLALGDRYTFSVTALGRDGESPTVSTLCKVMGRPGLPGIRRAGSGARGGPVTATVRWTRPSFDGGSAITGYRVVALHKQRGRVARTSVVTVGRNARSLKVTVPKAGGYRFAVHAINAVGVGNRSRLSNTVAAR